MRLLAAAAAVPLCFLFCHLYLRACEERRYGPAFLRKGLAGLCFVGAALLLLPLCPERQYALLTLGGLLLGLLGDQLLALRFLFPKQKTRAFAVGTLSFAAGHVLYLCALCALEPRALWTGLPLFALLLGLSRLCSRRFRISAGKLQSAVLVYISLVALMAATACGAAFRLHGGAALRFALGGLCFALSDNLLLAHSFGSGKTRAVSLIYHCSYYAAQLLIASSMLQ